MYLVYDSFFFLVVVEGNYCNRFTPELYCKRQYLQEQG